MSFALLSNQKPPEGTPCNGCGMCCQEQACMLSREYLDSSVAPCIALQFDGRLYRCGLVANPGRYLGTPGWGDPALSPLFAEALGIGRGCCSNTRPVQMTQERTA
jgi:hypothetical protein